MSKSIMSQHQPSLTEWFAAIGEQKEAEAFREEDNNKVVRLETLYQHIRLPYERPEELSARDLRDYTPAFAKIMAEKGNDLCAIRLVPLKEGLPKLRNRGLRLKECYEEWFLKQDINPDEYKTYVCPHSETLEWSATLVVNETMVFGEIVRGLHSQLTHGDTENTVYRFVYNFSEWQWTERNLEAQAVADRALACLRVEPEQQTALEHALGGATFSRGFLCGYFEVTVWPNNQLYIIDYNRLLPKYVAVPEWSSWIRSAGGLRGQTASPGKVSGTVMLVAEEALGNIVFPDGAILVCRNTDVRFLPFMQKAAAIVTEQGGILSHAAIVARELKKPCVIGVASVTTTLQTGMVVHVDAGLGTISF